MINPKYEYLREYVERIPKDFDNRNGNSFRAKFDKDDHGGWIGY